MPTSPNKTRKREKQGEAKHLTRKESMKEIGRWLDGLEEEAIASYGPRRWQQMVGRKEPADRLMMLLIAAAAMKDKKARRATGQQASVPGRAGRKCKKQARSERS